MALAAHAINNREKLDNMFAEQKKTRRDAAKKYGKMNTIIILTDSCKMIRFLIKLPACNYKNKKEADNPCLFFFFFFFFFFNN
jgi:nicotinic acid phosphoribosyltransferase